MTCHSDLPELWPLGLAVSLFLVLFFFLIDICLVVVCLIYFYLLINN